MTAPDEENFCIACGEKLEASASFCTQCAKEVSQSVRKNEVKVETQNSKSLYGPEQGKKENRESVSFSRTEIVFKKNPQFSLTESQVVSPWEYRSGSGLQMFGSQNEGIIEADGLNIIMQGYKRNSHVYAFFRGSILLPFFPLEERKVIIPYVNLTRVVMTISGKQESLFGRMGYFDIFHQDPKNGPIQVEALFLPNDNEMERLKTFFSAAFPEIVEEKNSET